MDQNCLYLSFVKNNEKYQILVWILISLLKFKLI